MKKGLLTSLEISETHVKLLQVKELRTKRIVVTCDVRPIHQHTDEELGRIFLECLLSKKIHPEEFILSIPRRFVILRQMRLPSQNEHEIKKMVGLQLVNQIPYPMEDVIFEHLILQKEATGYTHVLVAVVQKEMINRYLRLFNKVGLTPTILSLSSLGVLGWFLYQQIQKLRDLHVPVAFMNIDVASTEICFFYDKKLFYSRNVAYGARDLNADNMIGLVHQLELSLSAYEKDQMGPKIERMMILSSLPEVHLLKEKVEKEWKVPVDVFSPFDHVLSQKNLNLSGLKDQMGLSLSAGLGFVLSDTSHWMNFTPQEVHDTKRIKQRNQELVKFIGLFLVAFTLSLSILGIELYQRTVFSNQLAKRLDELEPRLKKAKEKMAFIQDLEGETKSRIYLNEVTHELFNLLPADITFSSLQLDTNGQFAIQGYAETSAGVNNLQAAMLKSPIFQDVSLQFATKRKIFNTELTDFKITCQLYDRKEVN